VPNRDGRSVTTRGRTAAGNVAPDPVSLPPNAGRPTTKGPDLPISGRVPLRRAGYPFRRDGSSIPASTGSDTWRSMPASVSVPVSARRSASSARARRRATTYRSPVSRCRSRIVRCNSRLLPTGHILGLRWAASATAFRQFRSRRFGAGTAAHQRRTSQDTLSGVVPAFPAQRGAPEGQGASTTYGCKWAPHHPRIGETPGTGEPGVAEGALPEHRSGASA